MNVIQISACPLRIRIDAQATGSEGSGGGQDYALDSIGEDYAVFVKVPADPVSLPPGDPNA